MDNIFRNCAFILGAQHKLVENQHSKENWRKSVMSYLM
jgi:hypothetical protein